MGQTLTIADQKQAYTISDRATWLAFTGEIQLPILVERDPVLLNVYHVMPVNPAKFPNVPINTAGGKAFADFMVAPDTQTGDRRLRQGQVWRGVVRPGRGQVRSRRRPLACRRAHGRRGCQRPAAH